MVVILKIANALTSSRRRVVGAVACVTLLAAACGSNDEASGSSDAQDASDEMVASTSESQVESDASGDGLTIVVTTNVVGEVVEEIAGDQVSVITIMPVGADPHDFQASARDVDRMVRADALVTNGAGFEEGLEDVIDNARSEGVPTHEAISAVDVLDFGEAGHHDGDGDEDHADGDHDGHDHDGVDPHFFNDPVRMAVAVDGLVEFLTAEVPGIDSEALAASAAEYVGALESLDAEIEAMVDGVPVEQRVLVTNHEVFGYFADRYGFEIVGVVIPGGSTTDAASAGELAELAGVIEAEGVPAIFADTSSSGELINVLADEVGGVEVVELFSESLGEPGSGGETYIDMQRTNAERVTAALS